MNDEARLHLRARRPGGQDDTDPAIAAALEKTRDDAQLAAWAEAERKSDAALVAKLRQVQPPPGLRDTILAGAKVGRRGWRRWLRWFNASAWRNFRHSELLAAAAIVMILAAALAWNYFTGTKPESNWEAYAAAQVAQIEEKGTPQVLVSSMPQIHEWLTQQTCPPPGTLPKPVAGLKIAGCSKMAWGNEPMSIVCFFINGEPKVHLVTVYRRNLPAPPPEGVPVFKNVNGYNTASWSEGERTMMLIGKVDEAELKKLMGVATAGLNGPDRGRPPLLLAEH